MESIRHLPSSILHPPFTTSLCGDRRFRPKGAEQADLVQNRILLATLFGLGELSFELRKLFLAMIAAIQFFTSFNHCPISLELLM
jgi:hypothetical protein